MGQLPYSRLPLIIENNCHSSACCPASNIFSIHVAPSRLCSSTCPHSALEASFIDIQSAAVWPEIPEDRVLLLPHEVRTTWREFMSNSNVMVQQVGTEGRETGGS